MPNVRTYRDFFNIDWKSDTDFVSGVGGTTQTVLVSSLSDLPEPADGIITLAENTTYHFVGAVNIGTNRLRVQDNSHLTGDNWGRDAIVYTGTDYAIIVEAQKLNMKFMGVVAPAGGAIRFNSPADKLTVFLCGFLAKDGCLIENAEVVSFKFCLFPDNTDVHLTFTGEIDKVLVDSSVFEAGDLALSFSALAVGTIDISGNYFKMEPGATGILSNGVTISNAGIIRGNSFEGDFTFTSGFDESTVGYTFTSNTGIPDSDVSGGYFSNTEQVITIATQGAWVPIADTFTATDLQRMTFADSALTYTGLRDYKGRVFVSLSGEAAQNNQTYELAIFKNGEITNARTVVDYRFGDVSQSGSINSFLTLAENDSFDVRIRNTTGTANFTLQTISVTFN